MTASEFARLRRMGVAPGVRFIAGVVGVIVSAFMIMRVAVAVVMVIMMCMILMVMRLRRNSRRNARPLTHNSRRPISTISA